MFQYIIIKVSAVVVNLNTFTGRYK